jgi:hypothetical protein
MGNASLGEGMIAAEWEILTGAMGKRQSGVGWCPLK